MLRPVVAVEQEGVFERLAAMVTGRPWAVVTTFVAIAIAAIVVHATAARYDMSYRTMTPRHTAEAESFEAFIEIFGDANDVYVVVFRDTPLLSPRNLAMIERVTKRIEADPLTRSVTSLTTALDITGRDGALVVEPFVVGMGNDGETPEKLARRLAEDPVIAGGLISRDGTTAAIVVRIAESSVPMERWFEYFDDIQRILREEGEGRIRFHLAGYPYLTGVLLQHMIADTSIFLPLTLVLMCGVLWAVFGRVSAMWMPLVPPMIAATWTLGSLTACGVPMSLLTGQGVLSTLVIVIGLSDAVHFLSRHDENRADHPRTGRISLLGMTLGDVGRTCFLTSLTTAIGFASLAFTDVPSVRDFGVFGAIGIGFAYASAMVLLPATIAIVEARRAASPAATAAARRIDAMLEATARLVERRPRTIVAAGFGLLAISAVAAPFARIDGRPVLDLKETDPVRRSLAFMERNLGGVYDLEIVFRGQGPDAIKDPEFLEAVDHVRAGIEALPFVSRVTSPVESIKKMNRAMAGGAVDALALPESADAIAQYLLLFEMAGSDAEFERLVSYDYSVGRMTAFTTDITPEQYDQLIGEIDRLKRGRLPPGAELEPSGEAPLWQAGSRMLISTLLQSLYIAMPLVFLVTGVAFRSARLGALSILPNVLPITVALALLAPLGISLRFSTIVAFPLAFGLAIDDTIHFLARYRAELAVGKSNAEAVRTTVRTTGRAMLLTSVLLIVGFAVFFASNFLGVVHVAVLLWIILAVALLGDLVLLPAMLLVFAPRAARYCQLERATATASAHRAMQPTTGSRLRNSLRS